MVKVFYIILLNSLIFNFTYAKDISIDENLNLEFLCELEKKIVKNSEYNYKTFLAKTVELIKKLKKTKIKYFFIIIFYTRLNKKNPPQLSWGRFQSLKINLNDRV